MHQTRAHRKALGKQKLQCELALGVTNKYIERFNPLLLPQPKTLHFAGVVL